MTKETIFGIELRKIKKEFSLGTLLFCLPFILLFVTYFVFGVDMLKETGLTKMWVRHVGSDDLLLYIMLTPLIVLPFSLLHYKSREGVYKAWLTYSALGLILFIFCLAIYNPRDFFAEMPIFLLGIAYAVGSIIIWLYGAITHFFIKKK